jgi:putative membrane-bound dehydrogenase-like protein
MSRRVLLACLFGCLGLLAFAADPKPGESPEGVLPAGADGKPLNLDFETGTLKDWTADGDAFKGQPVKGDTVVARRGDMKSQHQGQYWIGGYEIHGDKPQGTLTSTAFKVTHPWASYLIGGGAHPTTCVELVRKDTGEVFHRASGMDEENMRREVVDLQPLQGKEIFIRLVDKHAGGWGHLNFDDFRFHTEKPKFAQRQQAVASAADVYKFAGLPPDKAAEAMTVPEGFAVQLFAGEPDVTQPIAFCLDDRGRVWVAEAHTYPVRQKEKEGKDRIVIFEDADGDGKFDKRTVFMEGLNLVSGLEVGFGGVWIGAAPYLMFVPMKDGEDKPAGPPQILLDGWHYEDTHETLNTFSWGPDGWLYGCHGVFTHSRVGKPGTPDNQRVPINAGIWRYHPTRHVFEVFAQGTSNPWGLDFDDHGQAFCEACVIPHLFHIIQGARYQRQAGDHFNPYTYDDIKTIADHLHYLGVTPHSGNNRSDSAGGGHAHCGTMIYLGGAWPSDYRTKMLMGNIHGRRLNGDILRPQGSGYVAGHGPDFLLANDEWARFINMRYGPDGNVYLIDWYDKQACHRNEPEIWDRSNGRVYKISYRGTKPVTAVDLRKKSDQELVDLQVNPNDWYVRHARRILQERGGSPAVHEALAKIAFGHADETRRLRGLWALHVTGGLTDERIRKGLADAGAHVRAWTIQLALEQGRAPADLLDRLAELAKSDPSPVVRLYLASGAQRLPLEARWPIVLNLVKHSEDAGDHNLPLMYWYAAEPLAGADASRALHVASHSSISPILQFMARRVSSAGTPEALAAVVDRLATTDDLAKQRMILQGLQAGLKGRRRVDPPKDWAEAYKNLVKSEDDDVRALASSLAVTFGDPAAFAELRRTAAAPKAELKRRQEALAALLEARDKDLVPVLHALVGEPPLRGAALRGLANYDDAKTPAVILSAYPALSVEEKRDALNTLASRAVYGKALLEALGAKKIPATEVPAEIVRQLRNLNDKDLDARIAEVWGIIRTTPADRLKMIAQYRQMLTKPYSGPPDLALGHAVFAKTCQQCHTLFGVGGKVGPDITGSNRADLNYLLENILDPSAVIPNDYKATQIDLKSGRVITGIVRGETPAALTVLTANETLTVPRNEIDTLTPSNVSMMPDDLLKPLNEEEVRALFGYLRSPSQTPMLATADNAKDFFNGKDLTGWDGDPKLWKVEDGEIVGRSPGIPRNEFLKSQLVATDFRLTVKIKLVPDEGNSGIQFRSEALPDGEMRGPQADVGKGWWGKLYEENGRALLWSKSGESFVKPNEWNEYEVVATGSHVRTFINGKACVDLDDAAISRRGIFGLQIHSGGPFEVRFKEVHLEVLGPDGKPLAPTPPAPGK